jgi:3-methyladenine DNA glycosylase AlkD
MKEKIKEAVGTMLIPYRPSEPEDTADALRTLWLGFEPKSMASIKAELRQQQDTVGIPVSVLKQIGAELGKAARKRVDDFLPLARILWDHYGREGRVTAAVLLGDMELADPEAIIPILMELCKTCITWENSDWLAGALEPIVRKNPERWLGTIEPWLSDSNRWVRRSGAIVLARLPMKRPDFTTRSLELIERLLYDEELDVKRAVSFAIRLSARGDIKPVRDFLARRIPPSNPAATWVLCDAIRSMTKKFLPEFGLLLPLYEQWAATPDLNAKDRRSVESAIKTLQNN